MENRNSQLLAIFAIMRDFETYLDPHATFPVAVLFVIFAPLQGFLNFLVYYRRRGFLVLMCFFFFQKKYSKRHSWCNQGRSGKTTPTCGGDCFASPSSTKRRTRTRRRMPSSQATRPTKTTSTKTKRRWPQHLKCPLRRASRHPRRQHSRSNRRLPWKSTRMPWPRPTTASPRVLRPWSMAMVGSSHRPSCRVWHGPSPRRARWFLQLARVQTAQFLHPSDNN